MKFNRSAGILLHPTSLPGKYGIGDLGPEVIRFLDWLASTGQKLWQTLPLHPTGYGNSPYQCYSAFAGSPLLVGLDALVLEERLDAKALEDVPAFPVDRVDYDGVTTFKHGALRIAYERFKVPEDYGAFCETHASWLDDYALFMALKDSHDGNVWNTWEPELAARQPRALERARTELTGEIGYYKFTQYFFFRHWGHVKRAANSRGIAVVGDMPIFVAHDSADVWTHPELFYLDGNGAPTVVAGVPPDYFSATGQLWGNPLYRWDRMAADGYAWWMERLRMAFTLYDIVRIDHFRGFESYWEIPAGETTAIRGHWVPGPGTGFFHTMRARLGDLPIIAEDLGIITPQVAALRDAVNLPGMRVLQFAFEGGMENGYLPHHYVPNTVVYPGTHDNDTTRGWWASAPESQKEFARRYMRRSGEDISWDLLSLASESVADLAVVPMQDVLSLDSEGRMNTPGTVGPHNWAWRMDPALLRPEVAARLRGVTAAARR